MPVSVCVHLSVYLCLFMHLWTAQLAFAVFHSKANFNSIDVWMQNTFQFVELWSVCKYLELLWTLHHYHRVQIMFNFNLLCVWTLLKHVIEWNVEGYKRWENEEEDVSIYRMTLRKWEDTGNWKRNTKLHCVENNSLWKSICTCLKTDYGMNVHKNWNIEHNLLVFYVMYNIHNIN